ncbi:PAS domain-containing sensor histidine kinase [Sphaerotilus hippei]|nr:PAS domain-containing protein [Sphaerotilus hippei]
MPSSPDPASPQHTAAARPPLHLAIFHALHDAVLLYDTELRIVSANRAAERLFHRPGQQMLGRNAESMGLRRFRRDGSVMPVEDRAVWQALRGRCAVPPQISGFEGPGLPRRWIEVSATFVEDIAPEVPEGVVCTISDVTARIEAEDALRESEQRLRLFTEHSRDMVWIADRQHHGLLYVSPACTALWGCTVEALQQTPQAWLDAVHEDDRPRVLQGFVPLAQGRAEDIEYRVVRPDGSMIWVRNRAFPIRDELGELICIGGITEDITLPRMAEAARRARREADARLARFIEASPAAPCVLRRDEQRRWRFVFITAAMATLCGRPTGELLGPAMHLGSLTHPDDVAAVEQALATMQDDLQPWRHEFRLIHPERGAVWVEARAVPMRDADDAVVINGYLLDISERKAADDEVRRLNAELEQRVRERTADLEAKRRELESFTYSVSHDLKAPLRGIDGYSRLLLDDKSHLLDDEGREFVGTIRRATEHMARLIDDLLAYSRIERSRPALAPVALAGLVQACVGERQDELQRRGVRLTLALGPERVVADTRGLQLVLRNLLDNALKFTTSQAQPSVEIGCCTQAGHVRLWVRDNGSGFDMRYHDRIFEIFQRLHRAEDYPGTGVGLAIVRKALERMHGRVWAQSSPGQGATFLIELPCSADTGDRYHEEPVQASAQ